MKLLLVAALVCSALVAQPGHHGIHWVESEAHRNDAPVGKGRLVGSPSPRVPRDNPTITRNVYGYSPHWTSDAHLRFDLLTHIGLFDVTLNADGTISNHHNFPGAWAWTIDRAHRNGVKCEMVATCFGWYNIHHAIRSDSSIPNLVALASRAGMDGINMDFEEILGADRDTMTIFMQDLSAACRTAGLELTMATMPLDFANAYDFRALAETTDGLFMMEYNFHWQGGPEAGPTAPLFGWEFYGNLQMSLSEYLTEIGSGEKLLFGLPYYGWEWPTRAETTHSPTAGYGTALYYRDSPGLAQQHGKRWDDEGKTPWYRYNNGGWNQGWYDDDTSLTLKYREVHEHDLLGTGMWALGYDGSRRELWAALRESFNRPLDEFTNGDCETWQLDTLAVPSDTSPNPTGWHEGRRAQYRREDAVVRSGSHSIRHIPDSLGDPWPVLSVLFQDVEVAPGTAYEFRGWARKNDGRGNRMKLGIGWFDAGHEMIDDVYSQTLEHDTTAWRELTTGTVTAPPGAAFARLRLWTEGYGGSDHWDDLVFGPQPGVAETEPRTNRHPRTATIVRNVLYLGAGHDRNPLGDFGSCTKPTLLDAMGRKTLDLHPGANDIRHLSPGVYFVCGKGARGRGVKGSSGKGVIQK